MCVFFLKVQYQVLIKNILNVHSRVKSYFPTREIKVILNTSCKSRILIRFCNDFPAPSTLFIMAHNDCFSFLLFFYFHSTFFFQNKTYKSWLKNAFNLQLQWKTFMYIVQYGNLSWKRDELRSWIWYCFWLFFNQNWKRWSQCWSYSLGDIQSDKICFRSRCKSYCKNHIWSLQKATAVPEWIGS